MGIPGQWLITWDYSRCFVTDFTHGEMKWVLCDCGQLRGGDECNVDACRGRRRCSAGKGGRQGVTQHK